MLSKLLKYEFKATGRIFLPLYGALLIISVLERIYMGFTTNHMDTIVSTILGAILPTLFGAIIVAMFVVTFIMMIQRFYKNLLGREGYLMFTLPVSTSGLIWSKLIAVVVWTILSIIAAVLAFGIIFLNMSDVSAIFGQVGDLVCKVFGIGWGGAAVEAVILILAIFVSGILCVYLSLAIGQLSSKRKILCAVGAYIGINVIINNVILVIIAGIGDMELFQNAVAAALHGMSEIQITNIVMIGFILFFVIQAVVYFLITRYLLTKKLNLE